MSLKSVQSENSDDFLSIDFAQIEEVSRVFQQESEEILSELDNLILKIEQNPSDQEQINVLFRKVHTIKGSVGAVPGGQLLGSLSHEFESLLSRIKKEQSGVSKDAIDLFLKSSRLMKVLAVSLYEKREVYPEELSEAIELITAYGQLESISGADINSSSSGIASRDLSSNTQKEAGFWVPAEDINQFLQLSGELLILKNSFVLLNQSVETLENAEALKKKKSEFAQELNKISDRLHLKLQDIRKEKLAVLLQNLPVLVRQVSTELNKPVQFHFDGAEVLMDKTLGHDLNDCLVHLVRNSIDHGIEDQFERAVQGKSSQGNLNLSVKSSSTHFHIVYRDDGKGLDRVRIAEKAVKKGLVTNQQILALSDAEIFAFIFAPGFSTKDKITTMSGRGVGMDVVHSMVKRHEGQISLSSQLNGGTEFVIDIPIPKNILVESVVCSRWKELNLAVPVSSVDSITTYAQLQTTTVGELRYCQYKDFTVPMLSYEEIFTGQLISTDEFCAHCSVVFVKAGNQYVGLLVEKIDGQADLVLKSFGKLIKSHRAFKGVSVLPDGQMAYVVDAERLIELLKGQETYKGLAA